MVKQATVEASVDEGGEVDRGDGWEASADVGVKAGRAGSVESDMAGERAIVARAPQQARGKARVEAIIDATAATIAESGLEGVTMHGIAKRSKTPIGSLYHFFSDRDALLGALFDRHQAAMQGIQEHIRETPPAIWAALSADAAIDRLVLPFVDYLEKHPDCLALNPAACKREEKKHDLSAWRAVVDARMPAISAARRQLYAEMLHALAVGAFAIKLRGVASNIAMAGLYMREVRRALAAYLASVESEAG